MRLIPTARGTRDRRVLALPLSLLLIVGLLLAAGGGAAASRLITGKQVKDNSLTSADIKNKTLQVKDFHHKTVKALTGKDGASAWEPPPTGTVIKGGGVIALNAPDTTRYARGYVPLPFTTPSPLSVSPGSRNLYFGNVPVAYPGESNLSRCSGSAQAPTALPGTMCVYVAGSTTNISNNTFLFPGVIVGPDGADSNGFYVGASSIGSAAPHEMVLRYVWVYTAP